MRVYLLLLFMVVPLGVFAKPSLIITCGDLKGTRFDSPDGRTKTSTDGITNFPPQFILDNEKPDQLIVFWGRSREAAILSKTKNQITAIRVMPAELPGVVAMDEVHMYSLYPQTGTLYFTLHRFQNSGVPNSSSFYADCKFSRANP